MNNALIDIAAWRLVSELHRRYPDKFVVAVTHPCDGQYNCLTLFSRGGEHMADFNRPGRFHVFTRDDGPSGYPLGPFAVWEAMQEAYDMREILDHICGMLGLPIPAKLPRTTPATLVYRLIAAIMTHSVFGIHRWSCCNGYCLSEGIGGSGVSDSFAKFARAKERLRVKLQSDLFGEPAFRFWFMCKESEPVLCLETTGVVYTRQNVSFVLMDLYRAHHRINVLAAQVAGALML